jgi:DNA-binding response OmpR family regulator
VKKVVCIEDEPDMISLVEILLGTKGFEVIGAHGGHRGLEAVRRVKPDLVLLDLMMPDMDGAEVYQQMKTDDALKHIPVIVVTAQVDSIDRVLWQQVIKVSDYITKPFDSQELLDSIERVLAAQARQDSKPAR